MRRQPKCDLRGGWPECWNTECRRHGKAAKRWHEVNILLRQFGVVLYPELVAERNALYSKLTTEEAGK